MERTRRALACIAFLGVIVAACAGPSGVAVRAPRRVPVLESAVAPAPVAAAQTVATVEHLGAYLQAVELDQLGAYLASIPPPAPAPGPSRNVGGVRSYAWWYALAVCESGSDPPNDAWRTGYFGLEGGAGVVKGGRGWDAELAEAQDIYARAGDGAWGCAPVAWSHAPGG